jgi:hypothetical protein
MFHELRFKFYNVVCEAMGKYRGERSRPSGLSQIFAASGLSGEALFGSAKIGVRAGLMDQDLILYLQAGIEAREELSGRCRLRTICPKNLT